MWKKSVKEELFELYYMSEFDDRGLYDTLKLVGITEEGVETDRFLAEYKVWKQIKESKVNELREHERNNGRK